MDAGWRPIQDFFGYYINDEGKILDDRREESILVPIELRNNHLAVVTLVQDGRFRPGVIAVDTLMRLNMIEEPPNAHLYSLVHLDGDPMNCRLDNYGWERKSRPRPGERWRG